MKRIGLYGIISGLFVFLLTCPAQTMAAAQNGLVLCARSVAPALFPFFVLSDLMIQTGCLSWIFRPVQPLFSRLFGVSGDGASAFFLGACAGYPIGAKTIHELTQAGRISYEEGNRLLYYCNNAGPLFLIGTVGTGMFRSPVAGYLLLTAHIGAAFLIGLFVRKKNDSASFSPLPRSLSWEIFSHAVTGSVHSILLVCGYIILFQIVINAATVLFPLPAPIQALYCGLLEMTSGVQRLSLLSNIPLRLKLTAASALTGFGGLCVHFQTFGMLNRLSKKTYLTGKLLQGMLAPILTYFLYPLFAPSQTVFFTKSADGIEWRAQLYLNLGLLVITLLWYLAALLLPRLRIKK